MEVKIDLKKRDVVLISDLKSGDFFECGGMFFEKNPDGFFRNIITGGAKSHLSPDMPARRVSKITFTVEDY